jgi:plasmid maintenance system antidote protein VapI
MSFKNLIASPTCPSLVIRDGMAARNWTPENLAQAMGVQVEQVEQLLAPVVKASYYRNELAKAFGTSTEFWELLQKNHDRGLH